jgi:hypothetical protein
MQRLHVDVLIIHGCTKDRHFNLLNSDGHTAHHSAKAIVSATSRADTSSSLLQKLHLFRRARQLGGPADYRDSLLGRGEGVTAFGFPLRLKSHRSVGCFMLSTRRLSNPIPSAVRPQ